MRNYDREYLVLSGKFPYADLDEKQIVELSRVNSHVPLEELIEKQQNQFPIDLLIK